MSSTAPAQAAPSKITVESLVGALLKFGASDLHIKVGRPPCFRIDGRLVPAKLPPLGQEEVEGLLLSILGKRHLQQLEERWQVDASFRLNELGRFRCNVFRQRNTLAAVIRMIPFQIPRVEDLGVPLVMKELAVRDNGLLLVTGPTGSGKSTTLASLVQHLNETQPIHVLSIEDPIEYVFRDQKASVTQREVGSDTHSLAEGLHAGLRQDPDVIVVGEMRDYETIRVALTAAETGHLVMSTLHTPDAQGAIERILDVVPSEVQNQVRIQLGGCLVGVLAQQLLVKSGGEGRILATEVLVNSPAISNAIVENDLGRIPGIMASSNDYYQMQTLNQSLRRLVESGAILLQEALRVSPRPEELEQQISGIVRE